MKRKRALVLALLGPCLFFATPAPEARASGTDLVGTLSSYTSPDIWEVTCSGSTQDLRIRAVAPTNTPDTYVAIAMALTPRAIYGQAATSEVFGPGGVGSDVTLDRPGKGRMKTIVTVKQTGGNPGDLYWVNVDCNGSKVPPKLVLLRDG